MKKQLGLFILAVLVVAGASAQASISLTPPTITKWTQTVSGGTYTASSAELAALNSSLAGQFALIQSNLNTKYFNKFNGFPDLNKGFANANAASFDNASLLGYQDYDLFALAVGGNLGFSIDPSIANATIDSVLDKGDIALGFATGGTAVQAGVNLGFLVPNLYGSAKFGYLPQVDFNGLSYSQGMFGVGANYTVVDGFDLVLGLLKWRGLSAGTGLVYNGNKVSVSVPIDEQTQTFNASISGKTVALSARATNTKANLTVESSSVVIPVDLMTSVQALWFLNLGLGVGADLAFSSGSVKLGGSSDLKLNGSGTTVESNPGNLVVKTTDATKAGDFLLPRIAASVGVNLTVFKLDVPFSYYPLSNSYAVGVTAGVVW